MNFLDLSRLGVDPTATPGPDPGIPLAVRAAPPRHIRLPSGPGRWRALNEHDSAAITALQRIAEDHDRIPYRTTEAEIVDLFDPSVPHAAYGAFDDDGHLIAYGFVRVQTTELSTVRATCSGAVHPQWRDKSFGTAIVTWQGDIARHLLARSGREGPAQIVHFADETVDGMVDLLARSGYTARRWYTQMRRDLSEQIPLVRLGPYLAIEPWSQGWSDQARRAHNQAFSDYGESLAVTPEQWERHVASMVPEWCFVAIDRSTDRARVAGYILASKWEEDWPALGWREGYIEALGVLAEWRGRGVGRSLLTRVMMAFRDAGMDYAGIDVDHDEPTGAQHLYAELGFEPTHRTIMYAVDL
ncbi:MAG: N-acetyltransferase [Actinobacteria bacterium]|nr:N-acetyltransferase [Actinomycetota bacterium]